MKPTYVGAQSTNHWHMSSTHTAYTTMSSSSSCSGRSGADTSQGTNPQPGTGANRWTHGTRLGCMYSFGVLDAGMCLGRNMALCGFVTPTMHVWNVNVVRYGKRDSIAIAVETPPTTVMGSTVAFVVDGHCVRVDTAASLSTSNLLARTHRMANTHNGTPTTHPHSHHHQRLLYTQLTRQCNTAVACRQPTTTPQCTHT